MEFAKQSRPQLAFYELHCPGTFLGFMKHTRTVFFCHTHSFNPVF